MTRVGLVALTIMVGLLWLAVALALLTPTWTR